MKVIITILNYNKILFYRIGFRWKSGSVPEGIINNTVYTPKSNTTTFTNINQVSIDFALGYRYNNNDLHFDGIIDIPSIMSDYWDDSLIEDDFLSMPWS